MKLYKQTRTLSKYCYMPPVQISKIANLVLRTNCRRGFYTPKYFWTRELNTNSCKQNSPESIPEVINGIVAVDKPKGISSTDAVRFFQRLLTRYYKNLPTEDTILPRLLLDRNHSKLSSSFKLPARRVGHGGTLDPMASGVLVIGIGTGTQSLYNFLNGDKVMFLAAMKSNDLKVYSVIGRLGYTTDTLDLEGAPSSLSDTQHITKELLEKSLSDFIGTITQEPPRYSAVRVDGKRLYEYARGSSTVKAGTEVEVPIRVVTASEISLAKFWHEEARVEDKVVSLPHFELTVHCGKGFYIRSLVRDIGVSLNSSAHVRELRRKVQSPFALGNNVFNLSDYLDVSFLKKVVQENNLHLQTLVYQKHNKYTFKF